MNKYFGSGYLGRDPEVKYLNDGKAVCEFVVACKDRKDTEWVNCVAWEKTGELIAEHFKKGSFIVFNGSMKTRKWEKDGVTKYFTTVRVSEFEFGPKTQQSDGYHDQRQGYEYGDQASQNRVDDEGDLPF